MCVKVIDDLKVTYAQMLEESPKAKTQAVAEKAVTKHCGKKLSTKDNKLVRLTRCWCMVKRVAVCEWVADNGWWSV